MRCTRQSPCIRRISTLVTRTPPIESCAANSPVVWNDVTKFWALAKYEDIRFVSSNPALFTSTKGISIPDPAQPEPVQEGNLIFTDPPRHRQLRKLINAGFTRRQVTLLEPKVRAIVKGIVDDIDPSTPHEFAEEIASPLTDPADRRDARRAHRGLGAVPHVVGRCSRDS